MKVVMTVPVEVSSIERVEIMESALEETPILVDLLLTQRIDHPAWLVVAAW